MRQRIKKNSKRNKLILFIVLVLIIGATLLVLLFNEENKRKEQQKIAAKTAEILSHYGSIVTTNKEAIIYQNNNGSYIESGILGNDEIVTIAEEKIDATTKYFKISSLDNDYYIKYQDVQPTDKDVINDERYKNYIPFNENIITNDSVNFYDKEGKLVYNIKKSLSLPILIKYDNETYGVSYNNRLLKIKKDDIKEIINNKNTDLSSTPSIAVLNYHFFYDETDWKEVNDCKQEICHSKKLFTSHLKYIKENNVFTPTMEEYELYLDKKINLPKSVLITIDDGWRMQLGIDLLEEYELNGTVFLITTWFKEIKFLNDYKYIEFHSHGDNLHNQGVCPGGQGVAIKCVAKDKLLEDLALSRNKLNGSTVFCYPFYEYNNYSISVLKEAGFTMSFAGGFRRSKPGDNKYAIPRYVITNTTTIDELKSYIG